MSATYAIDEKKRRAQSEDLHETPKLLPPDEALKRMNTFKYPPKPGEGTEALARRLGELLDAPESRSSAAPPDEELQHALFAHWQRRGDDQALISLFYAWRGAESLLELALAGPRYGVDARREPPWGVLVEGGTRIGGWTLKRLLLMLRALDPAVAARAAARIKEGPFSLDERSSAAAMVEDRAWANALIDEWLALPPLTAAQAMDWDALALLGTTDDEARFRAFFEHAKDKLQWAGRNALLARALGRLPAQTLVDVLVPFVEEGLGKKWKSSNVEPYFKVLAHIESPDVARALASWLGEKSIAKIATDYFRAHPDLTSAIEPVAKGKGKAAPVARAMLESIARAAPAEAEPKAKGKKSKKSKIAGGSHGESTAGLPAVLVAPPWAAKKRAERPKLALEPIVEDERYALPRKPYLRAPEAQRSAAIDARILGGRGPEHLYEGAIFQVTDEVALRALELRERLQGARYSLDSFYAWLGERAVPHLMRLLAADLEAAYPALERAVSPRLALPCAALALGRAGGKARNVALAWLREHPREAALGLIPAALGEDDARADVAERALRLLRKAGHDEALAGAAERYGASEALERMLARSPYERFPPKMPPKPKWAAPERLGALELTQGGALEPEHAAALIQMLQISPIGDPYLGAVETLALLTPESKARAATALIDEYVLAGSPPSHEWVIGALALLSPEVAIARLGPQMRLWAADGKVPLLHRSLEALAAIGTDDALVAVYDAGQRSRYEDTREKVRDILEDVARARGISYALLEDLLVPELGLESGAVELALGERTLSVRLGDHLEPVLMDGGKPLAAFPRKGKKDDADAYAKAKARYAALEEAAETVGRGQILRLERAMRDQRSWSVADWRAHVLTQPLVRHLARRLVWQVLGTGQLVRVAEDLTLADAKDDEQPYPPDDARLVIAHPLRAPGLSSFLTWIEDYAVIQPFRQVGRETFALEPSETEAIRRAEGRKATYLSVLALTLGMGWKPIPPGDKGIDAITRELPGGLVARLGITPGLLFGGAQGRPEQTLGALTIANDEGKPARFDALDPLDLSELVRDVMTLAG